MDTLPLANTALAIDILKQLSEPNKSANILFSPICISGSLALAYKASQNDTATQMGQVLHFEKVKDVDFGFQSINTDIGRISSMQSLKLIKRLYVDKSLNCTKDFINSIKRPYPSELETVDFKDQPEETRQQINKSITELTEGNIENVLSEGSVSDQTKLLLLGAAVFSGKWIKKFNPSETKEVPFRINKTESKPVQMMQTEARFCLGFIKELKMQILELPFCNKILSMIILLPQDIEDDSTGLELLEKELSCDKFVQWTNPSTMANTKVKVSLPKFKLEGSYDLKPALTSLGMGDAFNEEEADFSGMSECKGVALSQAIHKACMEISEEGAEEADTTRDRVLMHKDEFVADRPFMFAVMHTKSRNLILCGKFCGP